MLGPEHPAHEVSYPQAMEMYTVVHQVAILSKRGDPLTLSEALPRLADLIHKN